MSLEDALNENTKAVIAHTAILQKMLSGAKPAAPAAGSAAKPADKAPAAPAKPAAAPAKAAATKKKAETTSEHVADTVKNYLKGGDEEERAARKAHVKAIIDYYGADRFTAIDPSKYDEALAFLDQFAAGEDPFAEEGEGEAEDQEDDDGVV